MIGSMRQPLLEWLSERCHTTFHRMLSASNSEPPVKEGGAAEDVALALEAITVVRDGIFERIDGGEVLVEEGLIGAVPEVLGGLEFGRVWRQEHQMEAPGTASSGLPR